MEQTGKVIAEYTDKGPFIEFIDRSPEAIAKRAEIENRAKQENKEKKIEIKLVEKYTENIKKLNNQLETGIIENIEKKDEDLDKKEIERNKLEINIKSYNYIK